MSYLFLQAAQEDLVDRIINVGMTGVYKDIGETFLKDDKYVFDIVQFRGTDDFNLICLLDVYDEMDHSMDLLLSENGITDEEVAEVWPDWLESLQVNFNDDGFEDYDDFGEEDDPDFDDFEDLESWN